MRQTVPTFVALLIVHTLLASAGLGADLSLASGGKSDYQIVKPDEPSAVDQYAVDTLAGYLKQIIGTELPVVEADKMAPDKPAIFVGLSGPAIERLGRDPLARLKPQEHVARSVGRDICLYGKGMHGNLHAVMEFLENSLGWRWYSVYEEPVVPSKPNLTLAPFNRRRGFSFVSREVGLRHGLDFYYQNGLNMGFDRRLRRLGTEAPGGIVAWKPNEKFVHSSFAYIPPNPESRYAKAFDWLPRKNYFETNPEFFSANPAGKRIDHRQLCFSNPALRKELTANILKHVSLAAENNIITLDAADTPDTFCYCPECKKLEEKYGGPGGPIYDYLIELCGLLKERHPRVMVKTLAYRRSQTQKPPILPDGQRLPDNLIISFAPIEDCYFADWSHPDTRIQETYSDLKAWSKVARHLWAWLYPNPWGTGQVMPVGNVGRVVTNMRLMHAAGVTGVFTDHNGFLERSGWSELQSYLLYKLMQDVNCDTDALIREFTDHQYGAAGPLARKYLAELEGTRKAMVELPPGIGYRSPNYNERTFPYLTTENIHRWQTCFDRMEELVAGQADPLLNVRLLRRELDFATLWKWFDLAKQYPKYYKDHKKYMARITAANEAKAPAGMRPRPLGKNTLEEFAAIIQGGGREKPLPRELSGIDKSRIRTFVPTNHGRQGPKIVADPDAARGFAATVHLPDMPLQFGFYSYESRQPPRGTHGARSRLARDQITPGKYQLHKLGPVTIRPDCLIWFSARSWATHQQLGEALHEPGADNLWEAYVSLKCDGPTYGGKAAEDQVLCDRIIMVRK